MRIFTDGTYKTNGQYKCTGCGFKVAEYQMDMTNGRPWAKCEGCGNHSLDSFEYMPPILNTVEARHKAHAFDLLAVLHGHYDIAPITEIKKEPDLKWDVKTDLWGEG